jgi:hypothetical protein
MRRSIKVAVLSAAFSLSGVTVFAATFSGGTLGMGAGDTVAVTCAGPSLSYSQINATAGNLACATGPTTTGTSSGATFVQAASGSPGNQVASETITFGQPVQQGDLLVGWIAQYNAAGQVAISDSAGDSWTRVASETFGNGGGDIALVTARATVSSSTLRLTISASGSTYLPYNLADYHVKSGALVASAIAEKPWSDNSAVATASTASAVPAGDLVVGSVITGAAPSSYTLATTQGRSYTQRATNSDSTSTVVADVLACNAGTQNATFTESEVTDSYTAVAVFAP